MRIGCSWLAGGLRRAGRLVVGRGGGHAGRRGSFDLTARDLSRLGWLVGGLMGERLSLRFDFAFGAVAC